MTYRSVRALGSTTVTSALLGSLRNDARSRQEFFALTRLAGQEARALCVEALWDRWRRHRAQLRHCKAAMSSGVAAHSFQPLRELIERGLHLHQRRLESAKPAGFL